MAMPPKQKIIVVCGPTSSGKSALALNLAQTFDGEIIGADSRQVYQQLDIGTSKPTAEELALVPHHLIDVCPPEHEFSVGEYQKLAKEAIAAIHHRKHLPFLVGGTGLYIDSVAGELVIPGISTDTKLRDKLQTESFADLFTRLKKLDPSLAKTIDRHNKRRLVRAVEVCLTTGKPFSALRKKRASEYDSLWLAIEWPRTELYQRIDRTIDRMIDQGLKLEVARLITSGVSSSRLYELGLEYRYLSEIIARRLSETDGIQKLKFASHQYAKRQLTWFKRNKKIHWLEPNRAESAASELVSKFI